MTTATIIKAVMSSAAEAELGALFLNAKEGVYLRHARYPLPLLAGRTAKLGMEFLSRNTPSIITGTH
jgi:hypothetical protein